MLRMRRSDTVDGQLPRADNMGTLVLDTDYVEGLLVVQGHIVFRPRAAGKSVPTLSPSSPGNNHSQLITKSVRLLDTALDGRDCEVHSEAMLVHITSANLSTYPDTMVICGKPNFLDRRKNIVTNPILIVEVVSPSTENYDRNEKIQDVSTIAEPQRVRSYFPK